MSVLKDDEQHAGLWCREVLAGLTEYLEGGLDAETRAKVEAHVQTCDRCERFGGAFSAAIAGIRHHASQPPTSEILDRLQSRLRAQTDHHD